MNKKFNIHGEEYQEKWKRFNELTKNKIDKAAIMEAFQLGWEIGYFKVKDPKTGQFRRINPKSDLFFQFNDGKEFVYTIIRMPIMKMKKSINSPISTAILNQKKMAGRKF